MASHRTRGMRGAIAVALAGLIVTACLGSNPAPTAVPSAASPMAASLPPPAATPSAAGILRIALGDDPGPFSPAGEDSSASIASAFVYAGLYRLDRRLVPQPNLAAAAPNISKDGKTVSVPLRAGLTFSDGTPITPADVVATYALALSPNCPFGDLCKLADDAIASVAADGENRVTFRLSHPAAALEAEVMAHLGIVSKAAAAASLGRLMARISKAEASAIADLVDEVGAATNDPSCLADTPPAGCVLATYTGRLEAPLVDAGVALPIRSDLLGADGKPDPTAYAAALYDRLQSLAAALAASGTDRLAAAFPILDLGAAPVASGPFRLAQREAGESLDLVRWRPDPRAGIPGGVHIEVIRDPAIASTALQTGEVDWLPEVTADQIQAIDAIDSLSVAARASRTYEAIVFNTRAGHPYADAVARSAFAACIDRGPDLAAATGSHGILASSPVPLGSWADASPTWPAYDPSAARAALEAAGYAPGTDGIMARDGLRLASSIDVRPGRGDLVAFLTAAAEQLHGCGIELDVHAVDSSGATLLAQLEYPNRFETVLVARTAGDDPDADLGQLQSRHITTEDNPGDGNIGGWVDGTADALIDAAAAASDPAARTGDYRALEALVARQVPLLPICWDLAWSATSHRLRIDGTPVDPSRPNYQRELTTWQLAGP